MRTRSSCAASSPRCARMPSAAIGSPRRGSPPVPCSNRWDWRSCGCEIACSESRGNSIHDRDELSKEPPPADPAQLGACEVAADSPDVIHLRVGRREGNARLEDEQNAGEETQG